MKILNLLATVLHLEENKKSIWKRYRLNMWQTMWLFFFVVALQCIVNFYAHEVNATAKASIIALFSSTFRSILWGIFIWHLGALIRSTMLKMKWIGYSLLILGATIVYFFEFILLNLYGLLYNPGIAQILAGTNPNETSEFLDTIPFSSVLTPISYYLAVILLSYGISHLTKKSYRALRSIFVIGSLAIVAISWAYIIPRSYQRIFEIGSMADELIGPYDRLIGNTKSFLVGSKATEEGVARIKNHRTQVVKTKEALIDVSIVVIVGETLRRDYLHCYGYPLENSPHIDYLHKQGLLTLYADAVSPTPATVGSITRMFSFYLNDKGQKEWYDYPSIITLLSQGGYRTNWTSNQEVYGIYAQPIKVFSELSDSHFFLKNKKDTKEKNQDYYDEKVLPFLEHIQDARKAGNENLFQVIHLMGSHATYNERYPKEFKRFEAKDIPKKLPTKHKQIIAEYVNSIYYNDYVVGKIIEQYSREKSIVLYFSDHGEVLFDDPKRPDFFGHALERVGVSIPFMVYLSPSMRQAYPKLAIRIEKNKEYPIMLDQLSHTLLDLAGLQCKYSDATQAFFSPQFNYKRPRLVQGLNKEMKQF